MFGACGMTCGVAMPLVQAETLQFPGAKAEAGTPPWNLASPKGASRRGRWRQQSRHPKEHRRHPRQCSVSPLSTPVRGVPAHGVIGHLGFPRSLAYRRIGRLPCPLEYRPVRRIAEAGHATSRRRCPGASTGKDHGRSMGSYWTTRRRSTPSSTTTAAVLHSHIPRNGR